MHAEWWGARGDGVTDSAVAITRAVKSGLPPNDAMTVQLNGGIFLVGSAITPPVNEFVGWTIQGVGRLGTTLTRTAGYVGPLISVGTSEVATRVTRIKTLGLNCLDRAAGTTGIRFISSPWAIVEDVDISNCEYGIHQTGGTAMLYRDVFLNENTRSLQIDNQFDKATVDTKLQHVHSKKARLYDLNIDGSFSTALVREINIYGLITDGLVPGQTGRTCLRIHGAERIRIYGPHLEECDPFMTVSDDPEEGGTGHILLYGGQFGDLHPGNAGVGIVWNTLNPLEEGSHEGGLGSVLEGLRVKQGTSTFESDYMIALRNSTFNTAPTGAGFVMRSNSSAIDDAYLRDLTIPSWTVFRADKDQPTHNTRFQRRIATETTTATTANSVISLGGGVDATMTIQATVVGKRTTNGDQAAYTVLCLFKTNAATTTTTVIGSSITPVLESAGAVGWDVTCNGTTGAARRRLWTNPGGS